MNPKTRNLTGTIMCNPSFSDVTVTINGIEVKIPRDSIDRYGDIDAGIAGKLKELTKQNAEILKKQGIKITVGGNM